MISVTNNASDWHPADIKAALEKAGWSIRRLARAYGFSSTNVSAGIYRPYPKMEALIAFILNREPKEIWPSRYDSQGAPNRGSRQRAPYHFLLVQATGKDL